MRRYGAILGSLLMLGAVPVPPQQITWIQPNVTATKAQSFTYVLTLREEGKAPRDIPVVNVLCGGLTKNAECSAVLPASAQPAVISGNSSLLTATDPEFPKDPATSPPFTGNQGCIYGVEALLYKIGERAQQQTNKQNLNATYAQFQAAKFKRISTVQLPKGNQLMVTGECVGTIVPWP